MLGGPARLVSADEGAEITEESTAPRTGRRTIYLSPDDAGRFFADATESAKPEGYAVVYAARKPDRKAAATDMEPTVRITGFQPRQRWPEGTEIVLGGG